jgi:hypothetical protein
MGTMITKASDHQRVQSPNRELTFVIFVAFVASLLRALCGKPESLLRRRRLAPVPANVSGLRRDLARHRLQ